MGWLLWLVMLVRLVRLAYLGWWSDTVYFIIPGVVRVLIYHFLIRILWILSSSLAFLRLVVQ